ncbi:putative transcriptional regulator [Catenovulum agarivorans DS-2]|uniref:Putative transcriptional regulator n=1 Tax=Catenovulum agarivorans DS-2 TaxID=1328313 RepID=W7QSM7_9ALTE|nr:GntR family transcriptional regulator [Catenovulum agarivorans]EWH08385.1 putative transcriptional regulator [Catenovulum agarivorans DS-2]
MTINKQWQGDAPIYKQLADKLKNAIVEGAFAEGDALPSVRVICSDLNINHITVSKALHELLAAGLIEKRRGLGMFVVEGAIESLKQAQRQQFFQQELPQIWQKIVRLEIESEHVVDWINKQQEGAHD